MMLSGMVLNPKEKATKTSVIYTWFRQFSKTYVSKASFLKTITLDHSNNEFAKTEMYLNHVMYMYFSLVS